MAGTTKDRILDTAERLFAAQGFDATSLRDISSHAEVNLAAVNYHFGTKEGLFDAVILRKATPVNQRRLDLLTAAEVAAADGPLGVEEVLRAFIAPTFDVAFKHPQFVKLMGRVQAEGLMARLMRTHFQALLARFLQAFRRAAPQLSPEDLSWRIHFSIGAMAHCLRGGPELTAALGVTPTLTPDQISDRLVAFLVAGFRTPVEDK
jgi:AcrR family transcriptional regulator